MSASDMTARWSGGWQAEWSLRRRMAVAPRQILLCYLALCAISLAAVMWVLGAVYAALFACAELLAMALGIVIHARHAADREFIGLRGDVLHVEQHSGGRMQHMDFNPRWVRVEPQQADGSLVRVSGQGQSIDMGRYVRPGLRGQLANELRWALRQLERPTRD